MSDPHNFFEQEATITKPNNSVTGDVTGDALVPTKARSPAEESGEKPDILLEAPAADGDPSEDCRQKHAFSATYDEFRDADGKRVLNGHFHVAKPASKRSGAKRQSISRDKKRELGLKRVELWVHPNVEIKLREYAEALNSDYLSYSADPG